MKIGIVTFCSSVDNYGQMMQSFALQRYLRDNGHDAYVIKCLKPEIIPKRNPFWPRALRALNPVIFYQQENIKWLCLKKKGKFSLVILKTF